MEIEQSFEVPFAADAVWRCFHDTAGIVACLPGAALSGAPQDGVLPLSMTVKLGPIVAAFAGEATMQLDDAQRAGSVSGGGTDRKSGSRVKGSAWFALHETAGPGSPTRVAVRVEYAIAGSLAQFSRGGIVQELAERLTSAFRDNLKAKLEADQTPAANAPAAQAAPALDHAGAHAGAHAGVHADAHANAQAPGHGATPGAVAPLDMGHLLWSLIVRRLRRLFGLARQ